MIDTTNCPECGNNVYFGQNFERVRDRNHRLEREMRDMAARHAVEKANWVLANIEREENHRFIQGKAQRQRVTITRLEKRLRALGKQPHALKGDDE